MKNKLTFMAVAILTFTFSFACTGCDTASGKDNTKQTLTQLLILGGAYAIGDAGPSGVGTVFYITDNGLHGLEAAPPLWNGGGADPTSVWIAGGSTQTASNGNTLTDIGTGLQNSNAIISQTGHTASAAQLCRDYTGGGKTDWFLPSRDELAVLYSTKDIVGGFTNDHYWSSSESDNQDAYLQSFTTGVPNTGYKHFAYSVRAIRAF